MEWTWLMVVGGFLIFLGGVLLIIGAIKEHQKEDSGLKVFMALLFIIIGVIILLTQIDKDWDFGPLDRKPYQEIKSVSLIPLQGGGFFIG